MSRADLSRTRAPIAATQTTSFLGELGGLGTGGDAIHPCRDRNLRLYGAHARLLGVALTGPLRVRRQQRGTFPRGCLQAVVSAERCAIRASVSEAPVNPGMGTRPPRNARQRARLARPMLPQSPFDALLNAQRLYTVTAPRPFINDTVRTRRGLINGRYEPLTTGARVPPVLSPSPIACIRLTIHMSISPHVASPSTRLGSNNPSPPPSKDASPAAPSTSPRASAFGARKPICLRNGPSARKIRTLRTTSWSRPRRPPRPAHIHRRVLVHAPSRAITILRPKPSPRAGPYEHPVLRRSLPPHPRT
ncbi:hypothetical protein B0H14DRAFT_3891613 [Mycena olivaceomarginata]|nr:hypothetical protein B0H14DRAFT_3891613 [Mycena olivaceomarginata]